MKYTVFLVAVFFSCAFGIDTVPSLNVTKYLGRWYQVKNVCMYVLVLMIT